MLHVAALAVFWRLMLSKASAAMPESRIAEYVYQLALPNLDRGEPGYAGPIGIARNQFRCGSYQCSFCLQETAIEQMNYIIALQRLFSGDFYVFYVSFFTNQIIREYTKSTMHQKYVCFDCTQKCSAYVREKEYCTWNIRVADVLQLFTSVRVVAYCDAIHKPSISYARKSQKDLNFWFYTCIVTNTLDPILRKE